MPAPEMTDAEVMVRLVSRGDRILENSEDNRISFLGYPFSKEQFVRLYRLGYLDIDTRQSVRGWKKKHGPYWVMAAYKASEKGREFAYQSRRDARLARKEKKRQAVEAWRAQQEMTEMSAWERNDDLDDTLARLHEATDVAAWNRVAALENALLHIAERGGSMADFAKRTLQTPAPTQGKMPARMFSPDVMRAQDAENPAPETVTAPCFLLRTSLGAVNTVLLDEIHVRVWGELQINGVAHNFSIRYRDERMGGFRRDGNHDFKRTDGGKITDAAREKFMTLALYELPQLLLKTITNKQRHEAQAMWRLDRALEHLLEMRKELISAAEAAKSAGRTLPEVYAWLKVEVDSAYDELTQGQDS